MDDYGALGLKVIKDFITSEEESAILSNIKTGKRKSTGERNNILRYGSNLPYKSSIVSHVVPDFLDIISDKLVSSGHLPIKPNSVTINEYLTGQFISPHIDSLTSGPIISIIGLMGSASMKFSLLKNNFILEFPPRCLVQMSDEIRYKWKHSILPVKENRYSMVFRYGESVRRGS